jgi:aminoglycoside phosphotransferase (APT) family kinase protein
VEWFGATMRPLSGGYSGETFLVGEDADRVVLRIYRRDPRRAVVDASLLRLVDGIVPVPGVVEVRDAHGDDPAVLVTEHVDGLPLDRLLADPPDDLDRDRLGAEIGSVLARLSGIPFLRAGAFQGADLDVSDVGWPTDLREFAQSYRDTGRLAGWPERDWDALVELIDQAGDVLEAGERRTVLAHSDFNPKNLLVGGDPLTVLAVVDWEFAHAGSPYADLGNFTRFERDPRLVDPLVETYVRLGPGRPSDPVLFGRAVDLWALIELAGGGTLNPVRELAAELLVAQARAGDLLAWPFPASRAAPQA